MLRVISELNRAVQIGLSDPTTAGDALVLITADDEWCDLIVERVDESGETEGDVDDSAQDDPFDIVNSDYKFSVDWSTTGHIDVRVPLMAPDPGSRLLTGDDENTDVFVALVTALGPSWIFEKVSELRPVPWPASQVSTRGSSDAVIASQGSGSGSMSASEVLVNPRLAGHRSA